MKHNGIDYEKGFECMTDTVVSVLAEGKFPTDDRERYDKFLDDVYHDRVLAIIEFPTIDIELEAWAGCNGDYIDEATDDSNNSIRTGYFVCIKGYSPHGDFLWDSDDSLNVRVNVDFSSPNWEQLLEADMLKALDEYAEEKGYSFTQPNFDYRRE